MTREPKWPTPDPVKGRALTALEAEERLGVCGNYVYVRLKRFRDGHAVRVRFPEPDGAAYPRTGVNRNRLLSYWWEQTVVKYGRDAKLLDGLDRPKDTPLKLRRKTKETPA